MHHGIGRFLLGICIAGFDIIGFAVDSRAALPDVEKRRLDVYRYKLLLLDKIDVVVLPLSLTVGIGIDVPNLFYEFVQVLEVITRGQRGNRFSLFSRLPAERISKHHG